MELVEPDITIIVEFLYEKKDIRFPSRYYVQEAYHVKFPKTKRKRKLIRSETTVFYSDYEFL